MSEHYVNVEGEWYLYRGGRAGWVDQTVVAGVGQCQGNACGDISITWNGHGYTIQNHGGRRVKVRIRFTFGFQCLDWTDVHLGPGQSQSFGNGAFCNPYEANYE